MKSLIIGFTISLTFFSFSQNARFKEANKLYANQSYFFAAEAFEDVLERTKDSSAVAAQLADCYDKIERNDKAVFWYDFIEKRSGLTKYQLMRSANVRRQTGNYDGSLEQFKQYEQLYGATDVTRKCIENHYLIPSFETNNANFLVVKQEKVNSESSEIGIAPYKNNQFLLSSSRRTKFISDNTYERTGDKFYSIFITESDTNGVLQNPAEIKSSNFHDGPIIYDPSRDVVYFTRNNVNKGKLILDESKAVRLKIYRGILKDNKIVDEVELSINEDNFSTGHPAITEDGKFLFFASDRPGGFGGSDIYKVELDSIGNTMVPVNMGKEINTSGNEFFPFFHFKSGKLFYASDGFAGLGGMDVYAAQLNSTLSVVVLHENLGAPVNSTADDFSFLLNGLASYGYFSSNRNFGQGNDDIYGFKLTNGLDKNVFVEGDITDSRSNQIVPNAEVVLLNSKGEIVSVTQSDSLGRYVLILDTLNRDDFKIRVTKKDYLESLTDFTTKGVDFSENSFERNIAIEKGLLALVDTNTQFVVQFLIKDRKTLQPIHGAKIRVMDQKYGDISLDGETGKLGDAVLALKGKEKGQTTVYEVLLDNRGYTPYRKDVSVELQNTGSQTIELFMELEKLGSDIATAININPIYFDLNKFNIRKDAKIELDKIVRILNEYPQMILELGSHTDCRESIAYNQILSDKRAASSINYIKKRISNPERIYGKGFGESRLVNDCACEGSSISDCSEEDHQLNRRTEFIVVKIGSWTKSSSGGSESSDLMDSSVSGSSNVSDAEKRNDFTYVVNKDDTLYRVFVLTGVSVDELKSLNNLTSNKIVEGQILKLK